MKLNYKKDVDITVFPLPEGNYWRDALARRDYFYDMDNSKVLDKDFFTVFNVSGKVIINRKYGIKNPTSKIENGIYYWDFPISPERDKEIKNNSKPMVTEEHLMFDFYCSFEVINNSETLKEEEKDYLRKKISSIPKKTIINVLERVSDNVTYSEEGEVDHNDVLINGRKVWGEEKTIMDSGIYTIGNVVLNFMKNFDFYNPTLEKEIREGKASGKGMSGIEDEIPGYTKEEFIRDYLIEAQKLIDEVESFVR